MPRIGRAGRGARRPPRCIDPPPGARHDPGPGNGPLPRRAHALRRHRPRAARDLAAGRRVDWSGWSVE